MKVLTILGSPKRKGNTSKVLDIFEDNLKTKGYEVERIHISDCNVNGCMECWACTKTFDEPGCIQNDDAISIFKRMLSSDAIVYASPLIGWDVSAQIKPLLDRHFSLVKGYGTQEQKSFIENKPVSLLITCIGPRENNTDLVEAFFDRFGGYIKSNIVRKYIVPRSMAPDFSQRAEETAKKMVEDIISLNTI